MYHFLLLLPARVPGHPGLHRGTWTPDNPPKTSPGAQRHPSPGQEEAEMGGAPSSFHCLLSNIHSPVKRTASDDTPTRTHVLGKCHREEWSSGNMQARGCSIWFKLKDREKRSSTFLSITGVQKVDIVNKSPGDLLQRGSRNMKCKYTEMAQIGVRTRP